MNPWITITSALIPLVEDSIGFLQATMSLKSQSNRKQTQSQCGNESSEKVNDTRVFGNPVFTALLRCGEAAILTGERIRSLNLSNRWNEKSTITRDLLPLYLCYNHQEIRVWSRKKKQEAQPRYKENLLLSLALSHSRAILLSVSSSSSRALSLLCFCYRRLSSS